MRRAKISLFVIMLGLIIGFAAISTTLLINGTSVFGVNTDDFDVIFTEAILDGIDVSETTISEDGRVLTFETKDLSLVNDSSILEFVVMNNSTQYDAVITMKCSTNGNNAEYYTITNTIPDLVKAKKSVSGNVKVLLKKASVETLTEIFSCNISASAVERTEPRINPIEWEYIDLDNNGIISVGDLYTYGNESFNVVSQTDDTVTMLAQLNLGTDYKQSSVINNMAFSDYNGWESSPGPKEIDVQLYDGNVKTYINEYVSFLRKENDDNNISGTLITLNELKNLGCTITNDYVFSYGLSCASSSNATWLVNGQRYWTRSSEYGSSSSVWYVDDVGVIYSYDYSSTSIGVRPLITISKELLK